MKRSHTLVLATTLALGAAAGTGQAATAGVSAHTTSPARIAVRGTIGAALPRPGAAARIRALGLEDGTEAGSDDNSGLNTGGKTAHGTIGSTGPGPNAAARIAALGLDD